MESTNDIDTQGYWTTDDYEALTGLAAYRYLAERIGDRPEAAWATQQYDSLLSATNQALDTTISRYGLDYLPCSLLAPNSANRCSNPEDANWTSPFGFGGWAWNASLFGATLNGPGISLIDATYAYGFQRLRGTLPPDTFGGFPGDYYSTGYNAGMGSAALASTAYRDQGILSYEFMIENSQSGPYSWWESSSAPSAEHAVDREAPCHGPRVIAPRLGDLPGEQGLVGFTGGAEFGRHLDRGPRCPGAMVERWCIDLGHQLPYDRGQEAERQDLDQWALGVADAERPIAVGAGAFRASLVHQ